MILNHWLQQKTAKKVHQDQTQQKHPTGTSSQHIELTTDEIAALQLFLGSDNPRFAFSRIATDVAREEAMATDGHQLLVLHVPELNANSQLYAIPIPALNAARGEQFPSFKSILSSSLQSVALLYLDRLSRVVQALCLIATDDGNGKRFVSLSQNKDGCQLSFKVRTERGKATAVLATVEGEIEQ